MAPWRGRQQQPVAMRLGAVQLHDDDLRRPWGYCAPPRWAELRLRQRQQQLRSGYGG